MASRAARLAQKITTNYKTLLPLVAVLVLLYWLYVAGISNNPPGSYLDESSIAYNSYLVARTGTSEEGVVMPLYFRLYPGIFGVYANPTYIYLLAAVYRVFPPSIIAARFTSATLGFAAALLMGVLAWRISRRRTVAVTVALMAMFTPWLFEVSRLVFELAAYPLALSLFLLVLHRAGERKRWGWLDCSLIAGGLALVTYSYSIGRLLAPLLALGLILFATNKDRLVDVVKTWAAYGVTLIPLLVFNYRHPNGLTERFYSISYIKPQSTWRDIAFEFIKHYLDNLSLSSLLLTGDTNPRHHVGTAGGSFFAGVFILALIGLYRVLKDHWQEPWWRFIIYGLLVSVVPSSLTLDQFHTLRMIPYPIFLLVLTIPALTYLLDGRVAERASPETKSRKKGAAKRAPQQDSAWAFVTRHKAWAVIMALVLAQAAFFQFRFHQDGPMRGLVFDAGYRDLYDAALAQPSRPIYLSDGMWGPAYIHSFWYSTIDGKTTSDFIRLPPGQRPPPGAIVISSDEKCTSCQIILKRNPYMLYRAL